jgi:hypothetical protein
MGTSFFLPEAYYFPFFIRDAAMLSTRFGYGRPAFAALAFAEAFCDEDKGVDFFFGFVFSQTGLDFIVETLTPCATMMSNSQSPPRWDIGKAGMVVQHLHVAGHFTPGNWGR